MKEHQAHLGFVTFLPDRKVGLGERELKRTLLDLAVKNKIPINHSCGGGGSCGTCRVRVVQGLDRVELRGEVEQAMANDRGFKEEERLACQISPVVDLIVDVPPIESESDW
jgi:ferredoxin, 2Fe-2S